MAYEYVYEDEENELKPEGDYEVYVERMEVRVLSTGTEKLSIQYRIRSDIEQPYGNCCLFEDIWKEKENPNVFNHVRINKLIGTQHPAKGTKFNGINEIINFMLGKRLVVHLVQTYDNYYNKTINTISYYKATSDAPKQLQPAQPQMQPKAKLEPKYEEISDDDLPF